MKPSGDPEAFALVQPDRARVAHGDAQRDLAEAARGRLAACTRKEGAAQSVAALLRVDGEPDDLESRAGASRRDEPDDRAVAAKAREEDGLRGVGRETRVRKDRRVERAALREGNDVAADERHDDIRRGGHGWIVADAMRKARLRKTVVAWVTMRGLCHGLAGLGVAVGLFASSACASLSGLSGGQSDGGDAAQGTDTGQGSDLGATEASACNAGASYNDLTDPSFWSTFDTTAVSAGAKGFVGAAYDGRYVYLVPYSPEASLAARFDARTPPPVGTLPGYSFF